MTHGTERRFVLAEKKPMDSMRSTPFMIALVFVVGLSVEPSTADQNPVSYRVLATNKTSTMQKEMQEAAAAGYRYAAVMGGETSFGGSEVVVVMQKILEGSGGPFEYRLLATSKTTTMQKEMQEASDAGFEYVGQSAFGSMFGGKEVVCILERDTSVLSQPKYQYHLLATKRTSTMQKELQETGDRGYQVIGLTVGQTAMGGNELVAITRRRLDP